MAGPGPRRGLGCTGWPAADTPSISRSASSTAQTISTARTTMLWNGLRQAGPSPASRAAAAAAGGSQGEFSVYRASGPVR